MPNKPFTKDDMNRCYSEGLDRLRKVIGEIKPSYSGAGFENLEMNVYVYPRQWPNSACGFFGLAMQAFWTAHTMIMTTDVEELSFVVVFHANRFAYLIVNPTEEFEKAFVKADLPGAMEFARNQVKWSKRPLDCLGVAKCQKCD